MFAKLLRFMGVVALAAAIVWLTREHLLPTPKVSQEPPPHYRSTPPPPHQADDLTDIKGIGPVFAAKLAEAGIGSFRALSEMEAETVAEAAGTSPTAAVDWISQARARTA